jgi:hypothetical protein
MKRRLVTSLLSIAKTFGQAGYGGNTAMVDESKRGLGIKTGEGRTVFLLGNYTNYFPFFRETM